MVRRGEGGMANSNDGASARAVVSIGSLCAASYIAVSSGSPDDIRQARAIGFAAGEFRSWNSECGDTLSTRSSIFER
jgi:hypothetical protein